MLWCSDDCCLSCFLSSGNEGNIFQIDEETGNISMAKAADIVGPITLTVLVKQQQQSYLVIMNGKMTLFWHLTIKGSYQLHNSGVTHLSSRPGTSGVTGDQQGPVRSDTGDHRGDEEEQEPSSLREGAIWRIYLQQLGPWEHDPPRPKHQPAFQGPSAGRGLCCCECWKPPVIIMFSLFDLWNCSHHLLLTPDIYKYSKVKFNHSEQQFKFI